MPRTLLRLAVPLAALGLLAGCAAAAQETPTPTTAPTPTATVSDFPLSIENCGFAVELTKAPERIVAIKSTSIEMLLALGLQDRLIGYAFSDGPVSEQWADRASGLVEISERLPGMEAVLDLAPDLVYAGWESNLTAEGAGDRATLAGLGVASFVSPAACKGAHQPRPLTFEHVFDEIAEVGRMLGEPAAAADLIADQRAQLAATAPQGADRTALWFSSGSDIPFVGGGIGAPQMVLDAVGLKNIGADIDDSWASMSWEAIVAADPDVIVLVDSAWSSRARKIEILESNPATAALRAVQEGRYLVIPFPTSEAGVRSIEAVQLINTQLAALP